MGAAHVKVDAALLPEPEMPFALLERAEESGGRGQVTTPRGKLHGPRRPRRVGYVYFAADDKRRVVKVGFTISPWNRIFALRIYMRGTLRMKGGALNYIGVVPGTTEDELAFHRLFRKDYGTISRGKIEHREWYKYNREMVAAIRALPLVSLEAIPQPTNYFPVMQAYSVAAWAANKRLKLAELEKLRYE